jgi:hypothetical protein
LFQAIVVRPDHLPSCFCYLTYRCTFFWIGKDTAIRGKKACIYKARTRENQCK